MRLFALLLGGLLLASGAAPAQSKWPLWEAYTARFLSPDGRILDHDANDRTTSEGQAYALFFSLVANDRNQFSKILSWTERNLANGSLNSNLPSWLYAKRSEAWQVADPNPASDADLWIAYSLLEAGRLWKNRQYLEKGKALAQAILERETAVLPGLGRVLLPGQTGFKTEDGFYELNASYVPLQLALALKQQLGDRRWYEIAESVPHLVRGSSPAGFVLDWIAYRPGESFSVFPSPVTQPLASYDAIRVYLWAGMLNASSPFAADVRSSTKAMVQYVVQRGIPPAEILPNGDVRNANGNVGFSAALMPLLATLGQKQALEKQRSRLLAEKDKSGLYGTAPRYYDQNLALFATGWMDKHFAFESTGLLKVNW